MILKNTPRKFRSFFTTIVKTSCAIAALTMLTGCFSMMTSGIDKATGGNGTAPGSMVLLDIVTLPVQAIVIPVMLATSVGSKPQHLGKNKAAAMRADCRNQEKCR